MAYYTKEEIEVRKRFMEELDGTYAGMCCLHCKLNAATIFPATYNTRRVPVLLILAIPCLLPRTDGSHSTGMGNRDKEFMDHIKVDFKEVPADLTDPAHEFDKLNPSPAEQVPERLVYPKMVSILIKCQRAVFFSIP